MTKEESIHFFADQEVKKNENTIFSKNTLKICEKNTDFPVFFMILLVLETYTRAETVFTKKSFAIYEGVLHFCSCFLQKKYFFGKNMFFLTSFGVYEGRQRFKIVKIDDFRSFQSKILTHLTRSTHSVLPGKPVRGA